MWPQKTLWRMLPPDQAAQVQAQSQPQSSASIAASAAPAAPTPRDTRAFQYRFSMGYVRALPEPQRPVEREVFGELPVCFLVRCPRSQVQSARV